MLSLRFSLLSGSPPRWVLASFWIRKQLFKMISGTYDVQLAYEHWLITSRKWSCGNHKKGIVSDALDFNLVCKVVSFGWKFGLVQASLELLTFIISVAAFVLLKYAYFVRYGAIGKVFWWMNFGFEFELFDSCMFGYCGLLADFECPLFELVGSGGMRTFFPF